MPLYIVTSTPEFDGNRTDLPPSVQYVGPCLWDGAAAAPDSELLPRIRPDCPVVYVSEGTAQVREPVLLRAAIDGLRRDPVQLVLTTGPHRDPRELGTLPPNMFAERFIPHSVVFPRTHVVVTNGGSSSVRDALRAGIPLVVVPMEWDQLENAQRVVESGAGVRIDVGRCSPSRLRDAVRAVLANERCRDNAARIAASFARAGQAGRAAELIEQLATQNGGTRCELPVSGQTTFTQLNASACRVRNVSS
jgi:MGT family glycosyltransferase